MTFWRNLNNSRKRFKFNELLLNGRIETDNEIDHSIEMTISDDVCQSIRIKNYYIS